MKVRPLGLAVVHVAVAPPPLDRRPPPGFQEPAGIPEAKLSFSTVAAPGEHVADLPRESPVPAALGGGRLHVEVVSAPRASPPAPTWKRKWARRRSGAELPAARFGQVALGSKTPVTPAVGEESVPAMEAARARRRRSPGSRAWLRSRRRIEITVAASRPPGGQQLSTNEATVVVAWYTFGRPAGTQVRLHRVRRDQPVAGAGELRRPGPAVPRHRARLGHPGPGHQGHRAPALPDAHRHLAARRSDRAGGRRVGRRH